MPTWRCPHCGAAQPETSRCWVCRRSSTSCSTCRHFRRGVAGKLGYCGLDRRRAVLTGDELRGCWERVPDDSRPADSAPWASRVIDPAAGGRASRVQFVPLDDVRPTARDGRQPTGDGRLQHPGGLGPRGLGPGGEGGFRYRLWEEAEG